MSKHPPRPWLAAALMLALAGPAAAAPELKFETRPPEPTATDKNPAPTVVVRVINGPGGASPDSFTLKQADGKLPAIKASAIARYVEGTETLGLVVLVEADPRYLTGQKGLIEAIEGSLAGAAAAGPPGSQAEVLLYSSAIEVRMPPGPLAKIADVKVAPKDATASGKPGRDLAGAVKRAIADLDKMSTARKALLVIGDGVDGEGAKAASGPLRDLAAKLDKGGVVTFAIVAQVDAPGLGAPEPLPEVTDAKTGEIIPPSQDQQDRYDAANNEWRRVKDQAATDAKALANGNSQKITSMASMDNAVGAFVTLLDDRYYVTFPGYDVKTKTGVAWDGKDHSLMLRIDGNDTTAATVTMTPSWSAPGGGGGKWWLYVLIPVGALVAIGGVIAVAKPKKKPIPLPPPPVAAAPPGPPREQVRQKTMFVAMDSESVFPMVGWVVFMNGPKRLKFHKIKGGITKIGTAANSDVIIDDGFMSTDHALIMMAPEGFYLQDNNSTNGTFLNDNKVAKKEELYDNDLILVGKTVLKFKSVM